MRVLRDFIKLKEKEEKVSDNYSQISRSEHKFSSEISTSDQESKEEISEQNLAFQDFTFNI